MTLAVILLALVLVLALLLAIPWRPSPVEQVLEESRGRIDGEALAEAEAEIEHLPHSTTPDQAVQDLPDWGPGVPRPPSKAPDETL